MNLNRKTVAIIPVLFVVTGILVGCATTQQLETTGQDTGNAVMTGKVKAVLDDQSLNTFDMGFQPYKGRVQLKGFINSEERVDKDKAENISGGVPGVVSVKND